MTTVRLNDEMDAKLSALIELEKSTKSEIIKKAISEYYQSHYHKKTPFEIGEALFGKYGAEEDLSQTYKTKLMEKMNAIHSH